MNKRVYFNILSKNMTYKRKLAYITGGVIIGFASLLFTNYIVNQLAEKERKEIKLWSYAMAIIARNPSEVPVNDFTLLIKDIVTNNTTIPSIITDENYNILEFRNISKKIITSTEKQREEMSRMAALGNRIEYNSFNRKAYYIFYDESTILRMLRYYPYVQLSVITIFMMFAFITFKTSKQDEQNRIWIGMAKETAHQLGTPTSSLLGWIEYLRQQNVDNFVVEEMNNDITRLLKVVDRFSKIGSKTILAPKNVFEIVENAVSYFKVRMPKKVELKYNLTENTPFQAALNESLFEWVIENLLKNSLDALSGKGLIEVTINGDSKWIYIRVRDTGKGISGSNVNKIFAPGFSTKTRGWGLGLSLSRRIIEDYHAGRIFVENSEVDKGTTICIQIKKL